MWLEWSMMGDGARAMTGARLRGSLVRDGQGFDFEQRHPGGCQAEKGHDLT